MWRITGVIRPFPLTAPNAASWQYRNSMAVIADML
jgi:hypothetical protein